ncbi:hypothetical protein D3C87_1111430 [compost metagenome]
MQTAVQVQQTGFIGGRVAQVETGLGALKQIGDRLRLVLHRPVVEQVVIGGEHRAVTGQFLIDGNQCRGHHQPPRDMHRMHGVDQRFLDRVVAIARGGGADRQGLVDPAGGFQGAQYLLETAGLHRIEHTQLGRAQGFFFNGAGVFEQRLVAEIVPHRATGAVAHQQTTERSGAAQGVPVFKLSIDILEIGHCGLRLTAKGLWAATLSRPVPGPRHDAGEERYAATSPEPTSPSTRCCKKA